MIVAAAPPAFFMVSVEIVSKPGRLRNVVDKVESVVGLVRAGTAAARHHTADSADAVMVSTVVPDSVAGDGSTVGGQPVRVRRLAKDAGVDHTPDAELVAQAVAAGRAYYSQTGRVVEQDRRDETGLREQGKKLFGNDWGFSHRKYPYLVAAVRSDLGLADDGTEPSQDLADEAELVGAGVPVE
jgi:hypothetical protein